MVKLSSVCKYNEKEAFFVENLISKLQGLESEPLNKIGSRNPHLYPHAFIRVVIRGLFKKYREF